MRALELELDGGLNEMLARATKLANRAAAARPNDGDHGVDTPENLSAKGRVESRLEKRKPFGPER